MELNYEYFALKLILILKKSLWQYRFSITITAISIALATGLLMSVFSIRSGKIGCIYKWYFRI